MVAVRGLARCRIAAFDLVPTPSIQVVVHDLGLCTPAVHLPALQPQVGRPRELEAMRNLGLCTPAALDLDRTHSPASGRAE